MQETKEEIKPNACFLSPIAKGEENYLQLNISLEENHLTSSQNPSSIEVPASNNDGDNVITRSLPDMPSSSKPPFHRADKASSLNSRLHRADTEKHMNISDDLAKPPPEVLTCPSTPATLYNTISSLHYPDVDEDNDDSITEIGNDSELKSPPSTPNHVNLADEDSSCFGHQQDHSRSNRKAAIWKTLFSRCRWHKPSWTRLSSFIVRNAPCFWCCSQRLDVSATHKAVLLRLNTLCGLFALGQIASAIFLMVVLLLHDNDNFLDFIPNLWNLNFSIFTLGILGCVLVVCVFFSRRVIRAVNLVGAVRYLWILMWICPLELFLVISLFDYHRVTHVWIRHWWHTDSFIWFRQSFCDHGTAHTKCSAPLQGGHNYASVRAWCRAEYDATDCKAIIDAAQVETKAFFYTFYTFFATWGLCLVVLIFLAIQTLESLVTLPIAESSRTSNIPIWFSLPITVSFVMGYFILSSAAAVNEKNDYYYWISLTYFVSGAIFTLAALLGWLISAYRVWSARDNRNRQIAVILFLFTMFLAVLSVGKFMPVPYLFDYAITNLHWYAFWLYIYLTASIFVASLMYSVNLINLDFSAKERGTTACFLDKGANSCTGCNNTNSAAKCPEWEEEEIMNVYRTIFKLSASVAAIMLIYAFGGLRYGFSLKKHLSLYQIDYV